MNLNGLLTCQPDRPGKEEKLQTSVNTATTSNNCFKPIPSLLNCESSVSVEHAERVNAHRNQKRLFLKFLSTKNQSPARQRVMEQMANFQKLQANKKQSQLFGTLIPPISFKGSKTKQDFTEAFHHFASIWLLDMGFKTETNKQMVIERARMTIPDNQIYVAVLFYELLGFGLLQPEERLELIMGTCKNGWEYFCGRLISFWNNYQPSISNK